MKKILLILAAVFLVMLIGAAIAAHLFLDSAIKKAVETVGPALTKVDVKLESASVSLFSGSGRLQGLVVGNPPAFKSPAAISIGSASLAIQPSSLLSDKVVIESLNLQAPVITFETDLRNNNLSQILRNLEETTGGAKEPKAEPSEKSSKPAKKLQVDELVMAGAKVHVIITMPGGKTATISMPDIRMSAMGTGPEGITPAELTSRVLKQIIQEASKVAATGISDLGKGALYLSKDPDKAAAEGTEKVTRGVTDFLKKGK